MFHVYEYKIITYINIKNVVLNSLFIFTLFFYYKVLIIISLFVKYIQPTKLLIIKLQQLNRVKKNKELNIFIYYIL